MSEQIEEKKTKVFVPEGAKKFTCPFCKEDLKVPKRFTSCNCGRWNKTREEEEREEWQTMSWGCSNICEKVYMVFQKKPKVNQSFFMGAFIEAHHISSPQEIISEKSENEQ